jgi:2-polyprenyl-3-methyl-5-hydroxy-6-metoxy-1,4-benzoquinol methylase
MQIKTVERYSPIESAGNIEGLCPACGCEGSEGWLEAPDRFHGRVHLYQLLRCRECSLVRLRNPPSMAEMNRHYGPDYDRSIVGAGNDPTHWNGRRKTLLRHKSGGSILDLGCSSGGFLTSLKNSAWKLYGIEMSASVAKEAEAKCGVQVFVGDILDAPFARESFDAITCFHVFEHLYHPREVLTRVAAWLKPEGVFYVMMPNIDSAGYRIFGSYWYALELPRHLYHWSPVSLRKLATAVGLEEVSLTTHREVFIEHSTRYILDDAFRKIGVSRIPMAKAESPSLPRKVVRKVFRLTALPILNGMASFVGDGESIHMILRKAPRTQTVGATD